MNTLKLNNILDAGNFDFSGFTGSFFKAFCEVICGLKFSNASTVENSSVIFQAQTRVTEFFEQSEELFQPLCRKNAFLKPENFFFAESLLKLGFSVHSVSDENFALGLAAVHDFDVHAAKRALLAGETPDPGAVLQMIAPCRSVWLGWNEAPKSFPAENRNDALWIDLRRRPNAVVSSEKTRRTDEAFPISDQESRSLFGNPLPSSENSDVPKISFSCSEVVENLRLRLREVQERLKALKKGLFGKSCSSVKLIDRLSSSQECEKLEKLFSTAWQAFRWIHEFDGRPTPEHLELLREYAKLGASSLCVLRTFSQEQTRMDYSDSDLFQAARSVLLAVSEKVGVIPHCRLESHVSPTMILKNFKTLNLLNQKDSAARLRSRIHGFLRELSEGKRAKNRIWQDVVKTSTELGVRFGEAPDSPFFPDAFEPYADEMPEFVSEAEAKELFEKERWLPEEKSTQALETPWIVASGFFLRVIQLLEERNAGNEAALENALSGALRQDERDNPNDSDPLQRLTPSERTNILRVRKEFQGTQIVFIGGNPQPEIKSRLEALFQAEFIWEDCGWHCSMSRYEPWINSDKVSCFIVRKSKCSHFQYLELVRAFQAAGKKCVRLRNEINPVVIATKMIKQCFSENR